MLKLFPVFLSVGTLVVLAANLAADAVDAKETERIQKAATVRHRSAHDCR
jgi:hypothetical protein